MPEQLYGDQLGFDIICGTNSEPDKLSDSIILIEQLNIEIIYREFKLTDAANRIIDKVDVRRD